LTWLQLFVGQTSGLPKHQSAHRLCL